MSEEKILTEKEAALYMDEISASGMVLGLDSIKELLRRLDDPEKSLKFVHIAGTNGKGSVLAYTSTVLKTAGYKTGIHMFGSGSAFNLNSELYDWNKSAPSVMVYFKVDTAAEKPDSTGSTFTAGNLALAGVAGLAVGAVVTALASKAVCRKKKETA